MAELSTLARGALIGGRWRTLEDVRVVSSPFDGAKVGDIGWGGRAEAWEAVDHAVAAMRVPLPAHRRAEIIDCAARLVDERSDAFAQVLALEAGKPLRYGRAEVARAITTLELSAGEARRLTGHTVAMDATPAGAGRFAVTFPTPVGVVAAITPFNFPLNLACHKIGPAIAAGCGVVVKPADKAPFSACLLADVFSDAGLPAGWLNVVVGEPVAIADAFAEHPEVRLITFTGSAAVGWQLRARAPKKRVALELGNATPAIVDETADVAEAADALVESAFAFSGQSCVSAQRVYAHESVLAELVDAVAARARTLRLGEPRDPETDVGPLITPEATQRVVDVIDQARAGGARAVAGAQTSGTILEPTVLVGSPGDASLLTREVFGPVLAVQPYGVFADAIAAANSTAYGLQAAVFTARLDRVLDAGEQLEFGSVVVNEAPNFRADQMPYGGVKESGNSREGPAYAIKEMIEERLIVVARSTAPSRTVSTQSN